MLFKTYENINIFMNCTATKIKKLSVLMKQLYFLFTFVLNCLFTLKFLPFDEQLFENKTIMNPPWSFDFTFDYSCVGWRFWKPDQTLFSWHDYFISTVAISQKGVYHFTDLVEGGGSWLRLLRFLWFFRH